MNTLCPQTVPVSHVIMWNKNMQIILNLKSYDTVRIPMTWNLTPTTKAFHFLAYLSKMSFSDLVVDINAMLDTAEPPSTGDCCIYKVPSKIRKLNEDAYTPSVVSIGPFHHGHPELQNMESQTHSLQSFSTMNRGIFKWLSLLRRFYLIWFQTLLFRNPTIFS